MKERNIELMERFGWKSENNVFFYWKDFEFKNRGITMYISKMKVYELSEIELYRLIKKKEERAKSHFFSN